MRFETRERGTTNKGEKAGINLAKVFENRVGRCKSHGFDPFLSAKEAADYLGVSRRFVYERIATSEIKSQPMGRLRRIRLSTLEDWLIRQTDGEAI